MSFYSIQSNNSIYNEINPERQLQKLLVNSLVDSILDNIKQFPTFKQMFSIFYYCYYNILLSHEMALTILKPSELVSYLCKAYPDYNNVINQWDMDEFLKLFNFLFTDNTFYENFSEKEFVNLFEEGFLPYYNEKNNKVKFDISDSVVSDSHGFIKHNDIKMLDSKQQKPEVKQLKEIDFKILQTSSNNEEKKEEPIIAKKKPVYLVIKKKTEL